MIEIKLRGMDPNQLRDVEEQLRKIFEVRGNTRVVFPRPGDRDPRHRRVLRIHPVRDKT